MISPSTVWEILDRHGLREEFGHLWNSALIESFCLAIRAARTDAHEARVILESVQDLLQVSEADGFRIEDIN